MSVKSHRIKLIDSKSARAFVKRWHYSGKVCANSQVHFGVFKGNRLIGVLQYGPSTDKRRMAQNLGVGMNEFLELNRMAMEDSAPKNSESHAIATTLRMLRKNYPFLKLILSFADACQCGDGTIYRASGFKLHSFKKNASLVTLSAEAKKAISKYITVGDVVARKTLDDHRNEKGKYLTAVAREHGMKPIDGFQMKYIYYFDKTLEKRHKTIEFDKIPDDVKMYKGVKRVEHESNAAPLQGAESGAIPTSALQSLKDNGNETV